MTSAVHYLLNRATMMSPGKDETHGCGYIYIYIYIYIIYLYIYIQINPAKNELGRISKTILDNINMKLFQATKINQWKNMVSTIKWFNSLRDKHLMKFVMFGIKDFYPCIMEERSVD